MATVLLFGCRHKNHHNDSNTKYQVSLPVIKDTTIYQDYVCQIHSIQHIELRALEKGYLQKIYVDEGQLVKKGQLLFHIMPVIYQAEVQKAEAEVNFAEIEYQNTKALADSKVVSKNELSLAKAKLEKARAELALARAHLGFTEIRAPFQGIVGRFKDIRLGSLLDEGALLTTLSDNSKMWVYFNVPETEYLQFAKHHKTPGSLKVKLQLANGDLFPEDGIVETIEADFNNETGNIAFRATFNNPEGILRNGETGNILMPVRLQKALLIPQKATFEILDKKYVFVLEEDIVKAKQIEIEYEMPHIYSVKRGLKANDKILIEGLRKVKSGQKIHYEIVDFQKILNELNELHAE